MGLSRQAHVAIPLVLLVAISGCTADPAEAKRTASTAILEAGVLDDAPGCSAAVAVDGDVVWAEARGLANLETGAEFETSTPFHIGSVGKQFTAMAVLMLAERGDLSLDASPAVYLDGLPAWAEDLTLNDLMHHTSGIKDVLSLSPSYFGTPPPLTNTDALEFVRTSPAAHPGTPGAYDYSNTNYALLADVVTEVTDTEFTAWMETNVFEPLDLEARIGPPVPSDPIGYSVAGAEFSAVEAWPWVLTGAGFVTMTLSDLVRWGDQLREPSLVRTETQADALSDGAPTDDGLTYGPGLFVWPDGTLVHSGDGAGHYTAFGVSADRHTTVAISCNQNGIDMDGLFTELAETWVTEQPDQ
jgi:CubicO group peptidase (beta-lactamase class C family)